MRLAILFICATATTAAAEPGFERALFVCAGRVVAARTLLPGGGGRMELEAGLAAAARAEASSAPEDADELLLIGAFLRRPPPELRVVPLASLRRAA